MKCCHCGKKVTVPKSLWHLSLADMICGECWEKKTGLSEAKYEVGEQGEIMVSHFKGVVREMGMGIVCAKCDAIHYLNPLIFIGAIHGLPVPNRAGCWSTRWLESVYIIPPNKYWCPLAS